MKRTILAALIAVCGGGAAPAFAADFESPIALPIGSRIDLSVERTRSGDRVPVPMTVTYRYRQEITPTEDGYRVRQVMTDMDLPDAARGMIGQGQLDAMAATVADITYDADIDLMPTSIRDWPALVERMLAGMAQMLPPMSSPAMRAATEASGQMFRQMTPETAASVVMREQGLVAAAQYTSLDLGKPIQEAAKAANPFGGAPIDSIYTIELESLDKTAGRAVIRTRSAFDPESASRSVMAGLKAMVARMPNAPQPSDAQLAGVRLERTQTCRYDMDIKSGLALRTDCTLTVTGTDDKLQSRTQSDHWVITQALTLP